MRQKNLLPPKELDFIRLRLAILGLRRLHEYYDTEIWKERRARFSRTHDYECRCGATSLLQLHHKTYICLGNEPDEHLEWKCDKCHNREHQKWTREVKKETEKQLRPKIKVFYVRGQRRKTKIRGRAR